MELADYLYRRIVDALRSIPDAERHGIYVISLFVYDEGDDPRYPTVTVGFNTEAWVAAEIARYPAEPAEARWNYACWEQNSLALVCDRSADREGAALREAWAHDRGYWYELAPGDPGSFDPRGKPLTAAFVALLVDVVRRLHANGDLVATIGRTVPVLIHELEYYDAIADQNVRANPPGLVDEFAQYCRGG